LLIIPLRDVPAETGKFRSGNFDIILADDVDETL
jgi:hypothetical protein